MITDPNWNTPAEAWYPEYTLNPFSNDTDDDGITDGCEMNAGPPCNLTVVLHDVDGDFLANAVDWDSDNDTLFDDEEVAGWNVSILPAWILRENVSAFLNATGDIDWEKFPMWFNSSDPYDFDTDNDTLSDGVEFWTGSNPRNNDTDEDRLLDADDWTLDENNSAVSLSAAQDMEGPEINVNGWTFGACSDKSLGDCANISLTLKDWASGVYVIEFQHLGSGWTQGQNIPAMRSIAGQPSEGALRNVSYWIQVPISGYHDRFGTFKIAITVTDWLGNANSTIYAGGSIFDEIKTWVTTAAKSTADSPWTIGYVAGGFYAGFSAGLDSVAFWDALLSGETTLSDMAAGLAQLPNMVMHSGEAYDRAYLDYMTTLALAVNPYIPSSEDLFNIGANETMFWMRDHGANLANASAWLLFAKAFWDGSIMGGILGTAIVAIGEVAVGAGILSVLKAIPLVAALLKAAKGLVGTALNIVKAAFVSAAKLAYKVVTFVVAKIWTAMKGLASLAADAGEFAFKVIRKHVDGIGQRIVQKFVRDPLAFVRLACAGVALCSLALGQTDDLVAIAGAFVRNSARGGAHALDEVGELGEAARLTLLQSKYGLSGRSMAKLKVALEKAGNDVTKVEKWFADLENVGLKAGKADFNYILRAADKVRMRARMFEEFSYVKRLEAAGDDISKIRRNSYSRLDVGGQTYRGFVDTLDNFVDEFEEVKSGLLKSLTSSFRAASSTHAAGPDWLQFEKYLKLHSPPYDPRIMVSREVFGSFDTLVPDHPLRVLKERFPDLKFTEGPSQVTLDSQIDSLFGHLPAGIGG